MHSLQRQRDAHIVIYVLAEIQFSAFRRIALREGSLHRQHQIPETPVAGNGNTTVDTAFRIDGQSVIVDFDLDRDVRIENVGIAESFKELLPSLPVVNCYA